jgi:hypothetical protein
MKERKPLVAVLPALGGLVLCLALAVSILAIQALIYLERGSVAEITIANDAAESIVGGAVEALGTTYAFSNIAVGQRTTVSFPITGEGGYRVRAQFESGRTVNSGAERYLASGFGVEDRADVTNDGINIRSVMPFRVKLLMKDGSETLTAQIAEEPLPMRREVIDVDVDGRKIRAMAHLLTWAGTMVPESSAPIPVVVAVEID